MIVSGQAVGAMTGQGVAHIIEDAAHIHEFRKGEVLVTDMTDPGWKPRDPGGHPGPFEKFTNPQSKGDGHELWLLQQKKGRYQVIFFRQPFC